MTYSEHKLEFTFAKNDYNHILNISTVAGYQKGKPIKLVATDFTNQLDLKFLMHNAAIKTIITYVQMDVQGTTDMPG